MVQNDIGLYSTKLIKFLQVPISGAADMVTALFIDSGIIADTIFVGFSGSPPKNQGRFSMNVLQMVPNAVIAAAAAVHLATLTAVGVSFLPITNINITQII